METKKCIGCGRELPVTEFRRQKNTKDGLNPRCKHCCDVSIGRVAFKRLLIASEAATDEDLIKLITAAVTELRKRNFEVDMKLYRVQEIVI